MAEGQIVHTPDSTGSGVRTVPLTSSIAGVYSTVHMQVIVLADGDGNIISPASSALQREILEELKAIRSLLEEKDN